MKSIFNGRYNSTYNTPCGNGGSLFEVRIQQVVPANGYITALVFNLSVAPGVGKSRTMTVRKNGNDTAVTVTISGTSTTGKWIGRVSVNAGDKLAIVASSTGSPPAATMTHSMTYECAVAGESVLLGSGLNVNATATGYGPVQGYASIDSNTESNTKQLIPTNGTLKNLYVNMDNDPGTAPDAYSFTLKKNGSATALSVTITANNTTGNNLTDQIDVAPGDTVVMEIAPLNSPSASPNVSWGMVFVPDIDGEAIIMGNGDSMPGATRYTDFLGGLAIWNITVEPWALDICTLKKFYVELSNSPYADSTTLDKYTLAPYLDGAAISELAVAIVDGGTGNKVGNSGANEKAVTAGQFISMQEVPTHSPAAASAWWGIVAYNEPVYSTEFGYGTDALAITETTAKTLEDSGSGVDAISLLADISLILQQTTWSKSLTQDYVWLQNRQVRVIIAASAIEFSGNQIRIRVKAHSSTATTFDSCSIGERDGTTQNFLSSPTRITWEGNNNKTVPAGTEAWSDWITFALDESKTYLVHFSFSTTNMWYKWDPGAGFYNEITATDKAMDLTMGNDAYYAETAIIVAIESRSFVGGGDGGVGVDAFTAVSAALALADTGAGVDALSGIALDLADSGAGVDALEKSVEGTPITLEDSGSGTDALTLSAALPLTDSGAGVDTILALAAALDLTDSGSGTDALTQAVAVALADAGSGEDVIAVISAALTLADSGAGVDVIAAIAAALALADTGSGLDELEVSGPDIVAISETGTGVDALTPLDAALALADAGTGVDALTTLQTVYKTLEETGSGVDFLEALITEYKALADSGSGTDALSLAAALALVDTGVGADTIAAINTVLALADSGSGADTVAIIAGILITDLGSGIDDLDVEVAVDIIQKAISDGGTGVDIIAAILAAVDIVDSGSGSENLSNPAPGTAKFIYEFRKRRGTFLQ